MTNLQADKTFERSGVSGKLKIVLHDVSGTLLRTLGTIERRGYDYRDVHCTQRVDGDFDLLVAIEDLGGPRNLDTLCKQLERLYNVASAEKIGRQFTGGVGIMVKAQAPGFQVPSSLVKTVVWIPDSNPG